MFLILTLLHIKFDINNLSLLFWCAFGENFKQSNKFNTVYFDLFLKYLFFEYLID